jgi:hypothetical protein
MEPLQEPCSIRLPFLTARKTVDPFDKEIVTYDFRVDTRKLPDMPPDANPRSPDVAENRRTYKLVRDAALEAGEMEQVTEGLFGYKNLGINVIAERVEETDKQSAKLYFVPGQGVLNGLHTLDILRDLQQNKIDEMPPNFVRVTVFTRYPGEAIAETAGANNNSVQVRQESLLNLHHDFDSLKESLGEYAEKIAWREGDNADRMPVADVLAALTCMRSDKYPTSGDNKRMPIGAYERRFMLFNDFRSEMEEYNAIGKLAIDILDLMEYVQFKPKTEYNKAGGKFGALKIVDSTTTKPNGEVRKKKLEPFKGIIGDYQGDHRLTSVATYPILGALRIFMRRRDIDGKPAFEWAAPPAEIKKFWDSICVEIVRMSTDALYGNSNKLNALGKDRTHWQNLQNFIKAEYIERFQLV